MRALLFEENLCYRTDYSTPQPEYNEALIRVTCAGICGTDLQITKGYMGFTGIPGHEFVGVVEQCQKKELRGKRVVGEINIGCNVCPTCQNRMHNHCPNRSVLGIVKKNGTFADYITLPIRNLHCIPDTVSDEEAVFVEPLAAAFQISQQIHIKPTHTVCVLGDGRLGQLIAQVISLTGCSLVVVGHHPEKLSILKKRGVETFLAPLNKEKKFDIVVESTGSSSGLEEAYSMVSPQGTIVLKTTATHRKPINLNSLVINEVSLVGSRCGPFAPAIRALAMKRVDVRPLTSKTFPLKDSIEAFRYASRKGVIKVIIKI